ncbi:FG-GAP-like repeat-containing protein [Streptomyces sp. URMC 127]|uniref:FG-GAP-like repeat-containing protein n=1 Tax=Streptomyces sp. URMC 127 TaxID=3423402 RepID=UPI003F1DA4FE
MTGLLVSVVAVGVVNGAEAGAVVGEPDKDGSYAFTTKLDIGGGQRGCSAALVAPQWLVTAASCFADNPAQSYKVAPGAPSLPAKATTGGNEARVVELVPREDRDLVMAKLAKPLTGIAPVALSPQAPLPGESLWLAGYGRTKDEWVPDRVHYGQFTLDKAENTTFSMTSKANGATMCKGDTGGPALRNTGGRYELAGINSRSWQGGCLGIDPKETRTGAIGTRADDITGWIREQVNRKEPVSEAPVDSNIDINGDGKADYLVLEDNGAVRAWINKSEGVKDDWSGQGVIATGTGAPASKVRFADIDGDRRADYLVVDDKGGVRAYINNTKVAKDSWINRGVIATGVGVSPNKIRFADINDDGKADYLVVEDNGAVHAYINKGGDGQGGWDDRGVIATGTGAPGHKVRFADINDDGKADYLVVEDNGAVHAWLNKSSGTKDDWQDRGIIATGTGAPGNKVRFADINGDRKADYLVVEDNGAVHAWLNKSSGTKDDWDDRGVIATGTGAPGSKVRI